MFMSWRNAGPVDRASSWDDYIENACHRAIEVVQADHRREDVNTLGFCVGGTLLATALAVAAARGEHPAESDHAADHLARLLRHGHPRRVRRRSPGADCARQTIGGKDGAQPGPSAGVEFANTFSFLRPNDLVWNYVVDNYLKGARRRRSTCCTGTAMRPTCRVRCTAGTCATPTSRTSCACRASDRVRRAGRPVGHRRAGLHLRLARRSHRAVEVRRTSPRRLPGGKRSSCSARRGISPA